MRSVEVDGVMALVEIEAGPHRIVAAVTRDAVEELGLAPGVPATAAVKATSVMVERIKLLKVDRIYRYCVTHRAPRRHPPTPLAG